MVYRIALALIALFWVAMNFLLWRSEFGGRNDLGNNVPLEMVWQKILRAPDSSSLDILHHKSKSGYLRWTATVLGEAPAVEGAPEGRVKRVEGYRLDLNGNVAISGFPERVHVTLGINLTPAREWKEFTLRISINRSGVTIRSVAGEESVRLVTEEAGERTERSIKFAELRDPLTLARRLDLPVPAGLPDIPAGPDKSSGAASFMSQLQWQARNDWVKIGRTSMRVYRLQAKLLDRYQIVILISPAGEILRVELPDEWVLANDQLTGW